MKKKTSKKTKGFSLIELLIVVAIILITMGRVLSKKAKVGADPRPYLRNKSVQWGRIDLDDLPTMDFDEHRYHRRIMQDVFKPSAMSSYTELIDDTVHAAWSIDLRWAQRGSQVFHERSCCAWWTIGRRLSTTFPNSAPRRWRVGAITHPIPSSAPSSSA